MRIIAGEFKSRRLKIPKSNSVRPTMDRVKETLFNIIGDEIKGARVLDLCAGCGSLGFEALSRGALSVCFVENNRAAASCIRENSSLLKVESLVRIMQQSVLSVVEVLHKKRDQFDFILFDPPYGGIVTKKTLMKLDQFGILARNGKMVIEHSAHEMIPELKHFEHVMSKEFGETQLSFLRVRPEGVL